MAKLRLPEKRIPYSPGMLALMELHGFSPKQASKPTGKLSPEKL